MRKIIFMIIMISTGLIMFSETLKVGLYEKDPLVYVDENGRPAGIFIDILNDISLKSDYDFDFLISNYDYLSEELVRGNLDMIVAMPVSDTNKRIFEFNRETIFTDWGQFYSKNIDEISTYLDLDGKSISFLRGDVYFQDFFKIAESMNLLITYKPEESYEKVFESIYSGKSDLGIVSWLYGLLHSEEYELKEINIIEGVVDIRFGFSKRYGGGFRDFLDSQILLMKRDPDSIMSNYFRKLLLENNVSENIALSKDFSAVYLSIIFCMCIIVFALTFLLQKKAGKNVYKNVIEQDNPASAEDEFSGIYEILERSRTSILKLSVNKGYYPVFMTRNLCELLGHGIEEFLDKKVLFWNLIHDEDKTKLLNHLRKARATLGDFSEEISLSTSNSDLTNIRVYARFINENGETYLYCLLEKPNNIMDLKEMTEKADFSQQVITEENYVPESSVKIDEKQILKNIVNSIPESLLIKDNDGKPIVSNNSYEKLMKELKNEFANEKEFANFCRDEEKKEYISDIHVISTGNEISYERIYTFKKGRRRVLQFSKSPYSDEYGNVIGVVILQKDITDKKSSEEKLFYNEKRLRETQKIAKLGTWEYNFVSNKFFSSEETFRIFGLDEKSDMDFDSFLSLFNTSDRKKVLNYVKRLEYSPTSDSFELSIENISGQTGTVIMKAEPVLENGILTKVLGSIMDVTEIKEIEMNLKRAKAEAESANRIKGEFLANMSHEIRTPMNAIVGMGHLLLKTEMTEKQKDYVNKIKIAANNLLGIINDILDFSKIEAGKLDFEYIDFSLTEVLDNIINVTSYKASQKGLEMIMRKSNNVPEYLVGDPLRLGQVLLNLVNNAIKFTLKGEIMIRISVVSRQTDEVMLRFDVKDTGIGLNKNQMSKLFKPFAQADASDTRKYGGTGLGLAICKKLVNIMEGDITVSSEVNAGSVFSFTAKFALQSDNEQFRKYDFFDIKELKILAVDDNEDSRITINEYLTGINIDCVCISNGFEAIELLKKENYDFDLILMDYKMPVMDGIDTTLKIKSDANIKRVPLIIMITAYANDVEKNRIAQCGFDGMLSKPFSPSTLMDKIMEVFGKKAKIVEKNEIENGIIKSNLNYFKNYKIMVVEDNDINRQITEEILGSEGLRVASFEDGAKAVEEYYSNRSYDIILMDLQMPIMDGYQATAKIREIDTDIPIIAMTADAIKGVSDRCYQVGMNDYISKPIDPVKMVEVLSKWLRNFSKKEEKNYTDSCEIMEFPESEHLDFKKGLSVVLGDIEVYKKILKSFRDEYAGGIAGKFRPDNPEKENKRLLHTLKGVSGNIGAKKLFEMLKNIEIEYSKGNPIDVENINAELMGVLEDSELLIKTPIGNKYDKNPKIPLSENEINEKLLQLEKHLKDNDMEAKETAEILRASLSEFKDYMELMRNINSFKFEEALENLKTLSEILKTGYENSPKEFD